MLLCNCCLFIRYPNLLPYHGPEEHDQLANEFVNYQSMPTTTLQQEDTVEQMGSFWAEMATRKHKVRISPAAASCSQ